MSAVRELLFFYCDYVPSFSRMSNQVSPLQSLPLFVKNLIIEHCYNSNDQHIVKATASLRASCKSFFNIIHAHPMWQDITQFSQCELCDLEKVQSKEPSFLANLYLQTAALQKCRKEAYNKYLSYYQWNQIPNVFHIHRVWGGVSELETSLILVEQEMKFGDTNEFRAVILVGIHSIYFFIISYL